MNIRPVSAVTLNDLNRQRQQIEEELKKLRAEAKESQATISTLDQAIRYLDRSITGLEQQIVDTETRITETTASINTKSVELVEQRGLLNEAIRVMYELYGSDSGLLVLIENENFSDTVNQVEYVDALKSKIEVSIELITAIKAELEASKKDLEELKQQKEDQQNQLASQRSQKSRLKANEAVELAALNQQIAADRAKLAQIEARIAREISALYRQRISGVLVGTGRRVTTGTILGGVGSTGYSTGPHLHFEVIKNGVPMNPRYFIPPFPWPLSNFYVTQEFGRPNWAAAYSWHTGIDLAAPTGTPVKSVCNGEVILSRWYGGYGNAVVIDCGSGIWTLYAHMN